ncbi:MAG: hypothetical protein ACLTGJ_02520 [Faecalibacterium prausnitzii]
MSTPTPNPRPTREIKVTIGTADRLLKMTGKADGEADAQKKLQAGIDEDEPRSNKSSILTVMSETHFVSGRNVEALRRSALRKYFTDATTHNFGSSGYIDIDL